VVFGRTYSYLHEFRQRLKLPRPGTVDHCVEMALNIVERPQRVIAIWVHTAMNPPQEEFDAACSQIIALRNRVPRVLSRLRTLIISDGGAPNIFQRTRHNVEALEGTRVPTSLISCSLGSSVARGIVNAVMWTNPAFKAFGPAQWRAALEYVDLQDERNLVADIAVAARQLSKPLKTLDMVGAAMRTSAA